MEDLTYAIMWTLRLKTTQLQTSINRAVLLISRNNHANSKRRYSIVLVVKIISITCGVHQYSQRAKHERLRLMQSCGRSD
jgi:hypothetical protein